MSVGDQIILDTCAAIWITEDDPISAEATERINRDTLEKRAIFLGIWTAWERAMLASKNKLTSPLDPKVWFERLAARPEIEVVPLTIDILIGSCFLPGIFHKDPSDRILVATARALDLTIVTRDEAILNYGSLGHVRTLRC